MKRALLVVSAGVIGILLGVGLSLAAGAIAGNDLSDPVPLGISAQVGNPGQPGAVKDERAVESPTPGSKDGGGGGPEEGSPTVTPEPAQSTAAPDGASSHDDAASGGSGAEGPDGDD